MECLGGKGLFQGPTGTAFPVQAQNQRVLLLLQDAVEECLLHYGISAWFGNLSVQLKVQITPLMQITMKVIGVSQAIAHSAGCL